jgi:hypothetical protein
MIRGRKVTRKIAGGTPPKQAAAVNEAESVSRAQGVRKENPVVAVVRNSQGTKRLRALPAKVLPDREVMRCYDGKYRRARRVVQYDEEEPRP